MLRPKFYLGYPIVIETVQLRMARLLALANLNIELTPHSLQHTHIACSDRCSTGTNHDRLGQITKHVYLHVTKEMKKEPSQKFLQLMRSLSIIHYVSISNR